MLECSTALKQVEDENNDCENEKDVNPRTERRAADQAHDPEKKENDGDRPQHLSKSPVAEPLSRPGFVFLNCLPCIRCEV